MRDPEAPLCIFVIPALTCDARAYLCPPCLLVQFYLFSRSFKLGDNGVGAISITAKYNDSDLQKWPYWQLVAFDTWSRSGRNRKSPLTSWATVWRLVKDRQTGKLPTHEDWKA